MRRSRTAALRSRDAMLPGTLFDVYLGSLGTTAAAGDEAIAAEWTVRAIGLVAAIAVTGCVA